MKNNILEIQNLTKYYGKILGVENLSLQLKEGEIFGFIGPNGAGKSTTIRSIMNLINKTSGKVLIENKEFNKDNIELKEKIGYLPSEINLYDDLTVREMLDYHESFYKKDIHDKRVELVKRFELDEKKKIEDLSLGNLKKLGIILAFMHEPKILILDEPTSGLDPIIRSEVLDIFLKFISDEDHTILLSTHITSDLEHIADKIIFIDHGQIILEDSRDEIMDNYGILKCSLEYFNEIDKEDIIAYKKNRYDYTLLVKDLDKIRKKYDQCILDKITLEDLMLLMIKGEKQC